MKRWRLNLLFLFFSCSVAGQQRIVDSLKSQLPAANDTLDLVYNRLISLAYKQVSFDSAVTYAKKFLQLSKKLDYTLEQAEALREMAYYAAGTATGLELTSDAQNLVEKEQEEKILPARYLDMLHIPSSLQTYPKYRNHTIGLLVVMEGIQYMQNKENSKALPLFLHSMEIGKSLPDSELIMLSYMGLAVITSNPDSSFRYIEKAYGISKALRITQEGRQVGNIEGWLADIYLNRGDNTEALNYIRLAIIHNTEDGSFTYIGGNYLWLSDFYLQNGLYRDSVFIYARKGFDVAVQSNDYGLQYTASKLLFEAYKKERRYDSAFKYLDIMLSAREKTSDEEKIRKFETTSFNRQLQQAAIEASNEKIRNKVRLYALLSALGIMILFAIFFWRNSVRRKKEFLLLEAQKARTDQALLELKTTQSQLIQSEKMASLGELTAGIAHEIQNPLNFVNNFSEVSHELADEMKAELQAGKPEEAINVAENLKQNLEKIIHHGKRADIIVKGMLQHSRTSSGQKEPADINALCEEYLRLAYHGLRAKDKSFNARYETHFDPALPLVNVIPQDIGRVILNLLNNAFYAVNEKNSKSTEPYDPMVTITTRKLAGKIEITVEDNGPGIPDKIKDKIFQPFFTTKPTGQGTGLGLSLSYDIVKAHGEELKLETKEGEGSEFIIQLPV